MLLCKNIKYFDVYVRKKENDNFIKKVRVREMEEKSNIVQKKNVHVWQTDTKKEMRTCVEINITFTIRIPK